MNAPESSILVLNANVITLDPKHPRAEAIAIHGEKIVAVGSKAEVLKLRCKDTKIIDCKHNTVVPGLVDCHVHMKEFGFSLQELNLRHAKSIEEMQNNLREFAEKNPEQEWILGGRWDEEKFSERRYPTRWDLDAVVSDKPVFLNRVCGHLSVANSRALQLASVTKHTRVKGGVVDLDEHKGEPNGILRGNATGLVWRLVPNPSSKTYEEACFLACQKAVESGLTEVHWLVSSAEEVRVLQKMLSEEKLPLRIYLGLPVEMLDEMVSLGLFTGFGNDMLKIGFVKILADGSLGTRTAALKKRYSDDPKTRGIMLYAQKKLQELILKAHSNGLQIGVHAIGDRAIENVIQAIEKALEKAPRKDHRHRIEHCSILSNELIARIKKLGLIASVQPQFVVSDSWTLDRVGPQRARWAYPFKTLLDQGIVVASGSDCPIELINPLLGIWAAIVRKDKSNESLTLEEALRTYTINAAYASFDENKKGTIEKGKYADLTIFSKDLTKTSPDKIQDVTVDAVIVNGKITYTRQRD